MHWESSCNGKYFWLIDRRSNYIKKVFHGNAADWIGATQPISFRWASSLLYLPLATRHASWCPPRGGWRLGTETTWRADGWGRRPEPVLAGRRMHSSAVAVWGRRTRWSQQEHMGGMRVVLCTKSTCMSWVNCTDVLATWYMGKNTDVAIKNTDVCPGF
jgi:hypothetical protein